MCVEIASLNVVMLFPERSEHNLGYLDCTLRNLAQLYCAQKHGVVPSARTFWIIFNVTQVHLDLDGNEQIQGGFNLAHGTETLHQSIWGSLRV